VHPPAPPADLRPPVLASDSSRLAFLRRSRPSRVEPEDEEHIRDREKMMKFDRTRLNHNLKPKANRDATSKIRQRRKSLDFTRVPCPLRTPCVTTPRVPGRAVVCRVCDLSSVKPRVSRASRRPTRPVASPKSGRRKRSRCARRSQGGGYI
jgi:hypothetical protein